MITTIIEKGIPIPTRELDTRIRWPFTQLEIGDSFFIDRSKSNVVQLCSRWSKKMKRKFIYAEVVDGAVGFRVWRTE